MADPKNPDLGAQAPIGPLPEPPKKGRNMSHQSVTPITPKAKNPDLGYEPPPLPELKPLPSGPPVAALQPFGVG